MDEYYSINLAEEVVRGMSEKARRGGTLGRLAYGYRSEQGRAVIDEEAAAVVRKIFRDFDSGVPVKRIAVELNECGIPTSKGLKWEGRTVEYILRNPYYIGTTHWTPEKVRGKHAETISEQTIVTEGTHPAIIDRELFDRCQDRVAENKRTHIYKSHDTHGKMFALKGLVRCSACGATLVSGGSNGVQCHMYAKGACKQSHFITKAKLDQIVIAQLEEDLRSGRFALQLSQSAEQPAPEDDLTANAVARLESQLVRVKEAYAAGIDTLEEYRENKRRILAQIEAVRAKQKPKQARRYDLDRLRRAESLLTAGLELYRSDAPEDAKNAALKALIGSITFDSTTKNVVITYR
jgi:hypothetical protein